MGEYRNCSQQTRKREDVNVGEPGELKTEGNDMQTMTICMADLSQSTQGNG
ncbi:hypothetical protein [Fidelibacter multiformis]|uniref:hypothetical protein n=1 Tax=Fidelibacter multiformis TaxID=3377529 RepID=UPI0037DCD27E